MQASLFEAEMTGVACAHHHALALLPSEDVLYFADFFSAEDASRYFAALTKETPWNQDEIMLYGKRHAVPRLTAWYGDPGTVYSYSGIKNDPIPWTSTLLEIRERLLSATSVRFNSVLLNRYRSGSDSLSWHADDERELGEEPVIASISLGAGRLFEMRSKQDHRERYKIVLEHGSLLMMSGKSQKSFEHAVPKERRPLGERINLTFRVIGERDTQKKPVRLAPQSTR